MKLSNASQPTCTSTSGEVHRVYVYITCPDTGTPLSCLNIVIICVCVCVCVCVCLCVLLSAFVFVQMFMRRFVIFLAFVSTVIYIFLLFIMCAINDVYNTTGGKYH